MKKILLTYLLFIPIIAIGQIREKPPSAIYLAYQPAGHGLGLRGDVYVHYLLGIYGSASYETLGHYRHAGLKNHFKLTIGILIGIPDYGDIQHDISVGLNYHHVQKNIRYEPLFQAGEVIYQNWSFEIGLTIKYPRFTIGMRTDILRWEPCIDIGIPLHKHKKGYYDSRKRRLPRKDPR